MAAGESAIRGGAAVAASTGSRYLLRFGVTVILARLLTPEQFGVVAMMTAVFSIGTVFQELGLSAATVQRTSVSSQAISTLFWINTGMGAVLTLAFGALSPLIAAFYSRPELTLLCAVTSVTFVLNGMAVQHRAVLQRQMRFGVQARINVAPPVIGGIVALLIAWKGGGIWSLAGQIIVTDALTLILLMWAAPLPLVRPTLTREARELLRFGVSLFGFQLVYAIASNLYVVLLGRSAGAVATGIYTRALALVVIPQSFVYMSAGYVALPKLSKLKESDSEFAIFYYRSLELVALISAPTVVLFALFADQIAVCAYGNQWGEVPALLRIFSLGMAIAPILHSTSQVFAARGEGQRFFRWGVVSACVMCATALVGLNWGMRGVAWGWSASAVILLLPGLRYAFEGTHLTIRGVIAACTNAWAAAVCMVPAGWLARHLLSGVSVWIQLPLSSAFCLLVYLLLAWFVFRQRELMSSVLRLVFGRRAAQLPS
ncbi:MAG: lipopolysaccharide biosynthesis protein [Panacagrimonas sp.]